MGTNYYMKEDVCEHCGRGEELKHIGKSSHGWNFTLHIYPEEDIKSLHDWEMLWMGEDIVNEYNNKIPEKEMLKIILDRNPCKFYSEYDGYHQRGGKTYDLCSKSFC